MKGESWKELDQLLDADHGRVEEAAKKQQAERDKAAQSQEVCRGEVKSHYEPILKAFAEHLTERGYEAQFFGAGDSLSADAWFRLSRGGASGQKLGEFHIRCERGQVIADEKIYRERPAYGDASSGRDAPSLTRENVGKRLLSFVERALSADKQ